MKELLDKYLAGETTRDEEDRLKRYYAGRPWDEASLMFSDLDLYRQAQQQPLLAPKDRYRILHLVLWPALGAVASLGLIVVLSSRPPQAPAATKGKYVSEVLVDPAISGEITDREMALKQTEKALSFVSRKMHKGLHEMQKIKKLQEGIERIDASPESPKQKYEK